MKYLFPRGKTKLVFSALGFDGTYKNSNSCIFGLGDFCDQFCQINVDNNKVL